jgi:Ca-activated chloride channel family protein
VDRLDVHFVELYTSVLDRRGRPVEGLTGDDFTVREDGVEQEVRRFELVREVPIYAGVLLDTSSSMAEELDEALAAASRFFDTVITPKDRAAVITFNHAPELAVRFTSDPEVLAGGLSGVGAAGGTALYDSLVYALYYFSGVQGKRALVLISDGDDQGSRYSFEEALDYARRTGVAIYAIGLGSAGSDAIIRTKLMKLAGETGGQWFVISRASELAKIYDKIEEELRTQYLLAYQSSQDGSGDGFRQVEVEVAQPGAQAKTIRGYYP